MEHTHNSQEPRLPPHQQLVAPGKWPLVGERGPGESSSPWTLSVSGEVRQRQTWTLPQLAQLPRTELTIDIHCVTRWSKYDVRFSGVLLAELLSRAKVNDAASFVSFVARSQRNHSSSLSIDEALKLRTLVAWEVDGQPLPEEHGGPIRSVVPGKYFYKSVKWIEIIELLSEDRLGYWEQFAGYHNTADPWREQRYIAATIDRREAARLIASKDFRGRDLMSLDASLRELDGLAANAASLRNANLSGCSLVGADFSRANLSNANLRGANLQRASLRDADMEGADFTSADLRGADFGGSSIFGASFCDADPSGRAVNGAQIDDSTIIPQSALQTLTPNQLAYVQQALQSQSRER